MKPIDFKKVFHFAARHRDHWRHFPRRHLALASSLALCLVVLLSIFPSKNISATRVSIPLQLHLPESGLIDEQLAVALEPPADLTWVTLEVKTNDNLSLLFQRAGLNDRDVYEFVSSNRETKALTRLYPGHQLAFQVDDQQKLQQLRYIKNQLESTLFERTADGFVAEDDTRSPDIRLAYRTARIDSNLTFAAKSQNMSDATIDELANIFGWDIDFALDIRKGDQFSVLYEEKFLDGEKIGDGNILAAEFVNQGTVIKAVRYEHDDGTAYFYTPDGKSMRKEFLQTPLNFRYISSGFNPKRLHPVTKTVRPHRGTDYAADRGTPVWAAGDGRVVASGYTQANGNYIVIQHGEEYQTKYLHLTKRYVKKGQRVRQKQTIGTVGSTGLATGPHLHYEFLKNGVHRNPRTIIRKLPQAKSISEQEMPRFLLQTQQSVAQLLQHQQATQLALADGGTSVN